MGEGQPRYSTEYNDEYLFKYRKPPPTSPGLFLGDDRDVLLKVVKGTQIGLILAPTAFAYTLPEGAPLLSTVPYHAFKVGLPLVLAGGVYGLTVGLVGRLRDKSDVWNHICAGIVSGQIIGSWYKNVPVGRWCSFGIAATGFVMKACADNNILYPIPRTGGSPLNFYRIGLFTERPPHEGIKDSS
ncbi:hypothetical protein BsWGS_02799 [Bradybaena similaris]